jgi:serine/threonine protein kinase
MILRYTVYNVDEQIDMWSLGIIFYLLLAGYLPFEDADWPTLMRKIIQNKVVFDSEYWGNVSEDAKVKYAFIVNYN